MTTTSIVQADAAGIERAAGLLRAGRLVAFPTETVYGLGGDATDDRAVAAIYAAKGRPQFNPLIIHVHAAAALDDLIVWNDTARLLADQFWPGPLTLVLPRRTGAPISLLASAGLDTLAVRVPAHPVARALLQAAGRPIAAPSANASGRLSPTTPFHVAESLDGKIDLILAGGKAQIGVESTVLDMTGASPVLLRPGGIAQEQLEKLIGVIGMGGVEPDGDAARPAPGMLTTHYAPHIPLRMNADSVAAGEALLAFGPDMFIRGGALRLNLSPEADPAEAAANLFAMLRQLDQPQFSGIAVMPIPAVGLGAAINDRLQRASAAR